MVNWMNLTTGAFNYSGLVENMETKAGMFFGRNKPFSEYKPEGRPGIRYHEMAADLCILR